MMQKVMVALLAVFLLSGCSSSAKKGGVSSATDIGLAADFEKNVGDRVFFELDSSALHHHSKIHLEKQGRWLVEHPSVNVTIEGHCDERGTREYNLALGERRADTIKKFLVHHGINSGRIDTISYGKERPAVIGSGEDVWKQNRRGVTTIK